MYYNKNIENIEKELNTSGNGLNNEEVLKRIEKYGKNTLPKKEKDSVLRIFLNEFKCKSIGLVPISHPPVYD